MLAIIGITSVALIDITPTDTKIVHLLEENKQSLLAVVGVVGAGIARDNSNRITGIVVYIEGNLTDSQHIPSQLGDFTVLIMGISKASEFEKERMIIHNMYYQLLHVTTDKSSYQQNNYATVTIKNESNETFTFGNSVCDLFFDRWNGISWEFYTGVLGLEVITYLKPSETVEVEYKLGGQTDKPFPAEKYRVISKGWLDKNGQTIRVWGHVEFTIE